ncbi:MAG: recombination protein RecR [Chitinivibrionales bacterium]|nr:recombination protein RecR [Chitinivibrionales bacterium]
MVEALEKLVESLSRMPTIGKKSAWRLALYCMERPREEVDSLAENLKKIKTSITICKECFNYSESEVCPICSSHSRDTSILCVVEKPMDVFTFENGGRYRGLYHVLGGVLSPINGITADKLHIKELLTRVETRKPREIILGLGAGSDAETTSLYLGRLLSKYPVRITRLARGLPAGLELEYVDQLTLTQALNERTNITYGDESE